MKKNRFSITTRVKSFGYAFNGLKIVFKEEHNVRVHLLALIIVIALGIYFKIENLKWAILAITSGLVISMEFLNSSIENLADYVCKEKHPMIKKVKDIAAAAVLISALSAITVGMMIFLPKLMQELL